MGGNKYLFIKIISLLSDKYGNYLVDLMEKNKKTNLEEITEDEARSYCFELLKKIKN